MAVIAEKTKRPPPDKLDQLCVRMLHPETGLSVKQQKYFRVAVPHACTGYELVQWLSEHLQLEDTGSRSFWLSAEAVHMASLLVHHGYMFPVIEQACSVKDDNTLYRFQIPYFWASHIGTADNVEYAIYLNKRLMRNEERHGLEAHEVEAYNKLMELLGHMWDFITVQAEMQLKLHKEKKKSDKVVLDSQERAVLENSAATVFSPQPHRKIFFKQELNRKPLGSALLAEKSSQTGSCLEQHQCKLEKKIKKKSLRHFEDEVERLKFSLKTKPWLKAPKASETMVSWCEQFQDYDPFITGCQPSNPWISDENSLWILNTDSVEVPTERRVRRWGFSVQELVRDPIGRQVLETFLESEFSSENIRFWMAIQDLKYSPSSHVPEKVDHIFEEFLAAGATCQVNVDSRTLEAATSAMGDTKIPQRYAFSQAEEHIFTLMSKDSYPRFVRSEIYKGVLNAAQQQGSKRLGWRNFIFNVGPGKKSYAAGPLSVPGKQKISRDDNSQNSLPKQLSSDSLPITSLAATKALNRDE